jgi:hypothetical protein
MQQGPRRLGLFLSTTWRDMYAHLMKNERQGTPTPCAVVTISWCGRRCSRPRWESTPPASTNSRAQEEGIGVLRDPAPGGQLEHEGPVHLLVELEVEGLQALADVAEAGLLHAAFEEAVLAADEFILDEPASPALLIPTEKAIPACRAASVDASGPFGMPIRSGGDQQDDSKGRVLAREQ